MIWKIRLKGKSISAYKSPDSIKIVRHIANDNSERVAIDYYTDSYRARYLLQSENLWVNASQVLVLSTEEEVEKPANKYDSDTLKVYISSNARLYHLVGETMEPDRAADMLPNSTTLIVDGTFMQHRNGTIEVYYRISDGIYSGYWIKTDSNVSVIENLSNPKVETKTKVTALRQTFTPFANTPASEPDVMSPSTEAPQTRATVIGGNKLGTSLFVPPTSAKDFVNITMPGLVTEEEKASSSSGSGGDSSGGDSGDTGDDEGGDTGADDRYVDGITIGSMYEDADDESTTVIYDSYNDYISGAIDNETFLESAVSYLASRGGLVGGATRFIRGLYNKYVDNEDEVATGTSFTGVPIYRYNFVHGLPFQFTPLTDRRYYNDTTEYDTDDDNCDQYGRCFAKTIVSDTPIVVFTPGLPRYLTSESLGITQSAEEQNSLANFVLTGDADSTVEELLNSDKNLEYFSLGVTTTEYFKYVNTLTRNSAILMEIGDMSYHSTSNKNVTLKTLDWGNYNKDIDSKTIMADVLGIDGGVAFAFDPQSSVSASMSNSTTDSSIASQINTYSAQVRELEFLAGAIAASNVLSGLQDTISSLVGGVTGGTTDDTGTNMFSRIGTGINNVVQGLNLKFPEIWSDSSYQKSYSCEMRFVSPYAALFSCWRYVLVPFFHLLPLAAPRATKSLNSYTSPFLIRAYSKGYFNVEMGIIDSMTYKTFGDGDMITADGIPMQIDCDISFHDLYKQLTVCTAGGTNAALFFNNTGLIDLLGTLSGVNMCRLSLTDRLSMFAINTYNSVMDVTTNFRRKISDKFNTHLAKFSPTY